jgi:CheY-like chemotaxis protein
VFTQAREALEEMNRQTANEPEPEQDRGILIYIVDDEPLLLELAKVVLEPLGYRIQTFRDGESALQMYAAAPRYPALIITDYAMHKMTGLGLIEACRRIRPRQKVLMVSGTVGKEIFRETVWKPDKFLSKPYLPDDLMKVVKSMVAGSSADCGVRSGE